MFDSRLSMFFLDVGIADIYQTIHPLNNPKTAKACSSVHILVRPSLCRVRHHVAVG